MKVPNHLRHLFSSALAVESTADLWLWFSALTQPQQTIIALCSSEILRLCGGFAIRFKASHLRLRFARGNLVEIKRQLDSVVLEFSYQLSERGQKPTFHSSVEAVVKAVQEKHSASREDIRAAARTASQSGVTGSFTTKLGVKLYVHPAYSILFSPETEE